MRSEESGLARGRDKSLPRQWHGAANSLSLVGQRAWRYKAWDRSPSTLQHEILKAIDEQDRAMAIGGVMAFAQTNETFGSTKQAEFLLALAEGLKHDVAVRLCKLHLSFKSALSGDNNFLCQAAWMMAGGVSPLAETMVLVRDFLPTVEIKDFA